MQETPEIIGDKIPVAAAGVICFRGEQVLLVKRAKPPHQGAWSIPGGRIEAGETAGAAALRELGEETGVRAELMGLVDVVDIIAAPSDRDKHGYHYVIIEYAAQWTSGEPIAADDAQEAKFVSLNALSDYHLSPETVRVIHKAAVIARRGMQA